MENLPGKIQGANYEFSWKWELEKSTTVIDRLRTLGFSLDYNIPNPDRWPSDINSTHRWYSPHNVQCY